MQKAIVKTNRLVIKPLTPGLLSIYINNHTLFEKKTGLKALHTKRTKEFIAALEKFIIPRVMKHQDNYIFYTLWIIILHEKNQVIGDLVFFGHRNQDGELEIGYGIFKEFENNGYMTEAIAGMIEWIKKQNCFLAIIASTESNNIASQRVLKKNKFKQTFSSKKIIEWKLDL